MIKKEITVKNIKVYVLIGIPGSGKSTYLKNHIIKENQIVLSSDLIRKELYGKEEIQGDGNEVFGILHERLINLIENGNYDEIYIDATHISVKSRNFYTKFIKDKYKKNKNINVQINALIFSNTLEETIKRDKERNRTVGKNIIYSMFSRYQDPTLKEGFEQIIEKSKIDKKLLNSNKKIIKNIKTFYEKIKIEKELNFEISKKILLENIFNIDNFLFIEMLNCEQSSHYHKESLFEHLSLITIEIWKDYKNKIINENELLIFLILMLFHDIGKPITSKRKFENLIFRGYKQDIKNPKVFYNKNNEKIEIENYNDIQFIGHENASFKIFNNEFKQLFIDDFDNINFEEISYLILEHLNFHLIERKEFEIEKLLNKYENFFNENHINYKDFVKKGTLFSKYDSKGRII